MLRAYLRGMLKSLLLQNFRNYQDARVDFSPGINWISGQNAQGKTNLLEAIYFLCFGRSFKCLLIKRLIKEGEPFFFLGAHIEKEGLEQSIRVSFDGESKRLQINATSFSHFSPLIGFLPFVLYAPDEVSLVSGPPAERRKFLDLHLSQIDPLYLKHLARYHKALRQRNELLKQQQTEMMDPWEHEMAKSGIYLIEKRRAVIDELKGPLRQEMSDLSGGRDELEICYKPSLGSESVEAFEAHLKESRDKELSKGITGSGPHRDELDFEIGGLSVKHYGSVGQRHTVLAALRLCQWRHLDDRIEETPLMGIDDFGSHLDRERQTLFQEKLKGLGQIFLTSPAANRTVFPDLHEIKVGSGEILEVSSS